LHTDLIFGLPGETMESFAQGFDRLWTIGPQEIQLGILKRLRGTPITRHTLEYEMSYDPKPPYAVLQTKTIDAQSVQAFGRMAKYWDLVANSARFSNTLELIMQPAKPEMSAFWSFMDFSKDLWQRTNKTFGFTPEDLVDAVYEHLTVNKGYLPDRVKGLLLKDYISSGARARPACLAEFRLPKGGEHWPPENSPKLNAAEDSQSHRQSYRNRQDRHSDLGIATHPPT
jgi:hypothetical protein